MSTATTPLPKVIYFAGMEGRAESIRLALTLGGFEFEDVGISHADWPQFKTTTPYGSVPLLEWEGKVIPQSGAILRFLGKKTGLYPADAWQAVTVDEVMDACEDLSARIGQTFGKTGDELIAARKKFAEEVAPVFLKRFEKLIQESGGKFVLGETLTVADLKMAGVLRWISSGRLDHVPTDILTPYPAITGMLAALSAEPKIAAFRAKHGRKP